LEIGGLKTAPPPPPPPKPVHLLNGNENREIIIKEKKVIYVSQSSH
jgi:hypothetical protein